MIRIMRIHREHPLYRQEADLRERVLLSPLDLDLAAFEALFPGYEERFEHFVAVLAHPSGLRVVGCALLLPDADGRDTGKLMQMAVDPQRRREGIGRRLVVEVERRAFAELGLRTLFCHAQRAAEPFYASLGWIVEGEPFNEAGIEHVRMVFSAPTLEHADAG